MMNQETIPRSTSSRAKNRTEKQRHHQVVKFTPAEDQKLRDLCDGRTTINWADISKKLEGRNARQCRERYLNYLVNNLSFEPWTEEEDAILVQKHKELGAKWYKVSKYLPGRSPNMARNRHRTLVKGIAEPARIPSYTPPVPTPKAAAPRPDSEYSGSIFDEIISKELVSLAGFMDFAPELSFLC